MNAFITTCIIYSPASIESFHDSLLSASEMLRATFSLTLEQESYLKLPEVVSPRLHFSKRRMTFSIKYIILRCSAAVFNLHPLLCSTAITSVASSSLGTMQQGFFWYPLHKRKHSAGGRLMDSLTRAEMQADDEWEWMRSPPTSPIWCEPPAPADEAGVETETWAATPQPESKNEPKEQTT